MLRMQIQLTEAQANQLRSLASQTGTSRSELIRCAIDAWLKGQPSLPLQEQKRRALEAVGKFASGQSDISQDHDRYLEDGY